MNLLNILIICSLIAVLFGQIMLIRNNIVCKVNIKYSNFISRISQNLINYRYDNLNLLYHQAKINIHDYNKLMIMDDFRESFIGPDKFKGYNELIQGIPSYNKMMWMFSKWTYNSFMKEYEAKVMKYYIESCSEIKNFLINSGVENVAGFSLSLR